MCFCSEAWWKGVKSFIRDNIVFSIKLIILNNVVFCNQANPYSSSIFDMNVFSDTIFSNASIEF